MSLEMANKVILPPKKNYIPQFLKQRDINSYYWCNRLMNGRERERMTKVNDLMWKWKKECLDSRKWPSTVHTVVFLQVFNEHPSRIISLEMIARLVSEAEDSLKLEHQVYKEKIYHIEYHAKICSFQNSLVKMFFFNTGIPKHLFRLFR